MAEYIEKGALMSLIESEAHRWGDDYDWWQCLADVEDFEPADVRPVVRGRWIEWWPSDCALIMTGEEMLWMCSECTAKFSAKISFCPNCGADMRGGESDG